MRLVISKRWLSFVVIALVCTIAVVANPPANLFYDTAILYDLRGVNPWPDHTQDPGVTFDILPFYQHAKGSKNCRSQKVAKGDRTGRLNMIGLLQGRGPAPEDSFDPTTPLGSALDKLDEEGYGPTVDTMHKFDVTDSCFTGTNLLGRYSTGINYERFGLRGQLRFNFGGGFGLTARSGAVCYKQNPCFLDLTLSCSTSAKFDCTETNTTDIVDPIGALGPECDNTDIGKDQLAGFSADEGEIIELVRQTLTNPQARCKIAEQLDIDIKKVSRAAFEDSHIDVHWSGAFSFKNDDDEHVVDVIPYLAAGVWLPSGEEKNRDILFSLPTGNDGFWGYTLEGGLNFEFPETMGIGFGGAVSFFPDSRTRCLRMPSSPQQEVLFPWTTEIKQDMGTTWHVHVDMIARDFLNDRLSFYFQYIYSKHQQDSYETTNPACAPLFATDKFERQSQWESQVINTAFDYRVTKNLYLGLGYQGLLTGRRIYRFSNLMGTIRFYFG